MKTLTQRTLQRSTGWLAAAAALSLLPCAHATLFFEEGFNYATGGLGTVGSSPNGPWTGGNANLAVTSGNLTYPGLTDLGGNQLNVTSGVSAGTVAAPFNGSMVTSGTVYYSFLADCTALPTANNYITSLLTSGTPNGSSDALAFYVGQQTAGSQFRVGVRHGGSGATYTSGAWATLNTVNLFVVAYTFNPSTSDDAVSLWVNPTPGGSMPTADVSFVQSGATDATGLQIVGFKAQSAATAGNWIFDDLRIGDTWGDVIPGSVPEPSSVALGGLSLLGVLMARRNRR